MKREKSNSILDRPADEAIMVTEAEAGARSIMDVVENGTSELFKFGPQAYGLEEERGAMWPLQSEGGSSAARDEHS